MSAPISVRLCVCVCVCVSLIAFEAVDAILDEHSTIGHQTLVALDSTNITMWGEG
jgi:hypothetical protein